MRVYVAGPMTGIANMNSDAFHDAAARLRAAGHVVHNPAESFGGDHSLPTPEYARLDTHALLQVESVVLLDGWERSVGACTEVAIASWLGLEFCLGVDAFLAGQRSYPENPIEQFRFQAIIGAGV